MCLFYEYVRKCNLRLSVPVKSLSPFSFGGSTVDRDQHLEHALVRRVEHHTIRDDCKRKVISPGSNMEAQEDFASPIFREDLPRSGRLMSFFEAMVLVLLRQFATSIVARLAVWGRWIVVADRKFKLHAKPSRLLSVEFNK